MNLIFTRNSPELLIFDLENHFQKVKLGGQITHVSMAIGNVIGQF